MKYKVVTVIVCLALLLTVVLPGTWAVSADSSSNGTALSAETAPGDVTQESTEATETSESTAASSEPSEETTVSTQPEGTQPSEATNPVDPTETTAASQPEQTGDVCQCGGDCGNEACVCVCHVVEKLLRTTDVEEFYTIMENMTPEQIASLTPRHNQLLEEHLAAIEPQPAPAIVLEESEAPVPSVIEMPTVNYTNVAPFGDPVTGK